MAVFLTSDAFVSLIISGIEVYRKEAAGILLGDYVFNSDTYYIKSAIPVQSATRKFCEIELHHARTQRMRENLELCLSDFIGYFHSHPQFKKLTSAELSQEDKESMKDGDFEIIISINDKKRSSPWVFKQKTMELSGCVGVYSVNMRAYSREGAEFPGHMILCPFTEVLNLFRNHKIDLTMWHSINKNSQRKIRRLVSAYEEAIWKNHDGESILQELSRSLTGYDNNNFF